MVLITDLFGWSCFRMATEDLDEICQVYNVLSLHAKQRLRFSIVQDYGNMCFFVSFWLTF